MQANNWAELTELYAGRGLSIIPVKEKRPLISEWSKYCLDLPEENLIHGAQDGIGVCTGPASNLVALDIDTDDHSIMSLCPYSPVVRRGLKGEIRFFQYSSNIESATYREHFIEILSIGRQAVLPPSIHPLTKKPYEWTSKDTLLSVNTEDLPVLDLSFLKEILKIPVMGVGGGGGRNNALKAQVSAALYKREKSLNEIAKEIYEYDRSHHTPRLFTDAKEGFRSDNEEDAIINAFQFVQNINKSLMRSGLVPVFEFAEIKAAVPAVKFEIKNYDRPEGILSDICELIEESAYTKVPNMALGSAISIFSILLGNRYSFEDMKANSFCLLLADSGTGKKFGINVANKLLMPHGLIGSADYLSTSGISASLTDDCLRLDTSDEFSKLLKLVKDGNAHQAAMLQDLCRLWSAATDNFALPVKAKRPEDEGPVKFFVESPYISMLTATTLTEFKSAIGSGAFTSGFVPRLLIFFDEPSRFVKTRLDSKKVEFLLEKLERVVSKFLKDQERDHYTGKIQTKQVYLSPDAESFFDLLMTQYHEKMYDEDNQVLKPVIARSREHLKKLSLIHALSRGSSVIEVKDLEWGCHVIEVSQHNSRQFMKEAGAENRTQSEKERVFGIIAKCGEIKQTDLCKKTQHLSSPERKRILQDLQEEGRISSIKNTKTEGAGRNTLIWFISEEQ